MRARPFIATGLFRVDAAPATWNQYVFVWDGVTSGNFHAYLYNDDQFVSTRGDIAMTGDAQNQVNWGVIYTDSSGLVDDGSLLMLDNGVLRVWDVGGQAIYEHTPVNTAYSGAVYHSGKVYWIENDGAGNLDVRRANTDLTSVETFDTVAHGFVSVSGVTLGKNSAALIFEVFDGVDTDRWRVPFTAGAATSANVTAEASLMSLIGAPRAGGAMAFINGDYRLCVLDSDSASASVTEVWPSWGLAPSGTPNLVSFSVNSAGTDAQLFNMSVGASSGAHRDGTSGSFGGSPATSFIPEDSPDGMVLSGSAAFFYAGD